MTQTVIIKYVFIIYEKFGKILFWKSVSLTNDALSKIIKSNKESRW